MKTILQVTGTMNRGGGEMMLMDLVRKLHNDFRFAFLITRKKGTCPVGDFDEELKGMDIPLYYIDAVWDVGIKEYTRQFNEIIKKIGKVNVIHSHLNSKGGIIAKCAAQCGIPKRIVHSHAKLKFGGNILSKVANYSELYLQRRWINKYATDYWACSEEALESLFTKRNRNSGKAQVIHNAIELEKFSRFEGTIIREELGIDSSAFVIGTVGRIAEVKNYELAADIVAELWEKGVDCHYVVAGRKQSESSVKYLFEKLGNDSRFHYIGMRSDLPSIYHGLDLYLGTSLREGLGLTAIEAQASGLPCLLSKGFPTLCDVGAGLVSYMKSDNVAEWAEYIAQNLVNKSLVDVTTLEEKVRKAGFDIEEEAEKVKRLYNE